jgi:hypothetical protein
VIRPSIENLDVYSILELFINARSHQDDIAYTGLFVQPTNCHLKERDVMQGTHPRAVRQRLRSRATIMRMFFNQLGLIVRTKRPTRHERRTMPKQIPSRREHHGFAIYTDNRQ